MRSGADLCARLACDCARSDHATVSLSVCIITRNERDNLPRCLASVGGLAAQIVVVDSHSTDGTQEFARQAGAEVIEHAFEGHVRQKQFALERATGDWVLCLDADEWLDDELRAQVADACASAPGDIAGYELDRRNEYLGSWIEHCGWSPQWRLRLVRRQLARWVGDDPHDHLSVEGTVARLRGRMCHRPYRSLAEHVAKLNRYTDTMASLRFEAGERATLAALLLRPPARFLRMFVVQRGFLDGWRGFVVCAMAAFYVFLKAAKLRELQLREASAATG